MFGGDAPRPFDLYSSVRGVRLVHSITGLRIGAHALRACRLARARARAGGGRARGEATVVRVVGPRGPLNLAQWHYLSHWHNESREWFECNAAQGHEGEDGFSGVQSFVVTRLDHLLVRQRARPPCGAGARRG